MHTYQRSDLDHSTIVSLMSFKFNCDSYCFDATLSKGLLTDSKKATYKSLHNTALFFQFNFMRFVWWV